MPKKTYKIEAFHGGLNSNADPRDIKDIESSSLQDINITNLGKMTTMGYFARDHSTSHTLNILPNRGLSTMSSDKKLDNRNSNETFIIAYDDTDSAIDIRDSEGWDANQITNFDSDLPIFYVGDGNLRVCDGEFDDSVENKWFGYINGHRFAGLNAGYASQPEIIKVTCVADSGDSLNQKYFDIYGADNHKTQIWIDVDGGSSQPSGSGSYEHNIEVTGISTNDTASTVATQVASAINANAEFGATASGNVVTITLADNGVKTDATAGDSGFTIEISQQGTPNGSEGDIGWTQANQAILSPTSGKSLISTPFAGSDSNGVNSTASEYIGTAANESNPDVAKVSSVNLRTGVQYNSFRGGNAASYGTPTNATARDTIDSGGTAMDIYPLFGNYNIHLEGGGGDGDITLTDGMSLTLTEEKSIILGIFIKSSKYPNLSEIKFKVNETGVSPNTSLTWEFVKEEIKPDCWNLISCNLSNITEGDASGTGLDTWELTIDRSATDLDFYLSGPVISENPGLQGYQSGLYTFYHTYLYDEQKQESLPFLFEDTEANVNVNKVNIVGGSLLFNFDAYINPYDNAGSPAYSFNKRISGSRLYYKLEENDNFYLIGELDFIDNGFKWLPEGNEMAYSMVNVTGDGTPTGETFYKNCVIVKGITPESSNVIDTFKSMNGYGGNVSSLDAKFKTAVVHGRRTYIGNIKQPRGSSGKTYPDRMLKSQINKFDVFPDKMGSIDVAINDGESIVKLEAYADRILQFKEKTMYIINVSETTDFLEETLQGKGCSYDYHVTKTDYGVAWFNLFGVYFFDGRSVSNLLEKDGMRLINESDWESFITDGVDGSSDDLDMGSAHIAYIPKRRQLLIKNENTDIYLYDFVLKAWMTGKEKAPALPSDTEVTNFALNGSQELFYLSNTDADVYTWSPNPSSNDNFLYITKDIDFGQPSVRKKIYKAYISYTSGSGGVPVCTYGVDGDSTPATAVSSGSFSANQPKWTQAEFKFGTDVNNCYSFQLKLTGAPAGASFEINDITIVYRIKNPR